MSVDQQRCRSKRAACERPLKTRRNNRSAFRDGNFVAAGEQDAMVGACDNERAGNQHEESEPRAQQTVRPRHRDERPRREDDVRPEAEGARTTDLRRTEEAGRYQKVGTAADVSPARELFSLTCDSC